MENQHKKIKGYRDLSKQEIDLMNRIKEHGEATKNLLTELRDLRHETEQDQHAKKKTDLSWEQLDESYRCIRISEEKLQTGQMWLVRAVALPESF